MLIVVTGGSGSGKSAFAEETVVLALEKPEGIYIATMHAFDEESHRRVRDTDTCVKVRALRQWNVIQSWMSCSIPIGTARFFWNVCPILWQTKCFRNAVPPGE